MIEQDPDNCLGILDLARLNHLDGFGKRDHEVFNVFADFGYADLPLVQDIVLFLIIWVLVDFSISLLTGINEIYEHRPRYTGVLSVARETLAGRPFAGRDVVIDAGQNAYLAAGLKV